MIYYPEHIQYSMGAMQGLNWMSQSIVNTLAMQSNYSPFYGKKFRASDGCVFEFEGNELVKEYKYEKFLKEYDQVSFIKD